MSGGRGSTLESKYKAYPLPAFRVRAFTEGPGSITAIVEVIIVIIGGHPLCVRPWALLRAPSPFFCTSPAVGVKTHSRGEETEAQHLA